MATFQIEQPDGSVFEIEAPDGATESDIARVVSQQLGGAPGATQTPQKPDYKEYEGWGDYINDAGRTALHGATLGTSDEITAGLRSILPESIGGADYDTALSEERQGYKRFQDQNPATSLGLELAGGFALPGLGAARGVKAAASLGQKVATGAKFGVGYGAAGGFGVGEGGFGERLKSARTGAKWGLGLGAAIPVGVAGLQKGAQAVNNTFSRAVQAVRDDEAAARQYIADKWRSQGITPNSVADDLRTGQEARAFSANSVAELPEAIADTSRASQRVLRGVKVGGDADDIIETGLINRQAGEIDFSPQSQTGGQFARVYDQTARALGIKPGALRDDIERLKSSRAIEDSANFRQAELNATPFYLDDVLSKFDGEALAMPDPKQRNIMVGAIRLFQNAPFIPKGYKGHKGPEAVHRAAKAGVQDIRAFQKAKFALDDLLELADVRKQKHLYRQLTALKNELVDAVAGGSRLMPKQNAKYIEALDTHHSYSQLIDAAKYGAKVAKGLEELSPQSWAEFTPAEKEIARKAWLTMHRTLAAPKKQGRTSDYANFYQKPKVREDLQIMLPGGGRPSAGPGGTTAERLKRIADGEVRMSETTAINLGGSPTVDKASDLAGLSGITKYLQQSGGPVNAVIMKFAEKLEELGAVRGRRARYLAKKLLTTDPQEQAQFLADIKRTMTNSRAQKIDNAVEAFTVEYSHNITGLGARQGAMADQPEYQRGY